MPLQMSPPSQIESPLPCEERSALCFGSHLLDHACLYVEIVDHELLDDLP